MAFSKARRLSDLVSSTGEISSYVDGSITHADLHTNMDLTGKTVLVTTQSASDNDTSAASTAYVTTAISNLIDSAPGTMNTLNEIAAALNDDANFNTTVTNAIAAKLPLAGGTLTGGLTINHANGLFVHDTNGTSSNRLKFLYNGTSGVATLGPDSASGNTSLAIGTSSATAGFTTALTLDSSQNATFAGTVGIGSGSGTTASSGYDEFVIQGGNADIGMAFLSPAANNKTQTIAFGDSNNNKSGSIAFDHSADSLTLKTAGEIILDADLQGSGNGILLKDAGTLYGSIFRSSSHLHIKAEAQDKNLLFLTNNGGSEKIAMTIDSSGRVGINRTPSISNSKLEVGGADDVSLINVEASGNTGGLGIGSTGLKLFHGSSAKMTINSSGNVGIGIAPVSSLHIVGNNTAPPVSNGAGINGLQLSRNTGKTENIYLYLNSTNTGWSGLSYEARLETYGNNAFGIGASQSVPIVIASGNTERMRVHSDGKVGIGTQAPNVLLTLNQSANSSGLHYSLALARNDSNHLTMGYEANGSTHSAGFISSQNGLPLHIKYNGTTRIHVQEHSVNLNHRVTMPASSSLFKYVGMQSPNLMTWEGMNHVDSHTSYPAGNNTRNDGGNVGGQTNAMGVTYGMNQQDARGNKWKFSSTPKGTRDIVWQGTAAYSGGSGGDAGWGANMPMDFRRSYLYTTYIRRVSSAGDGSFYFGCHNCRYNSGGTLTNQSNPYFDYFSTGTLTRYEWYLCYYVIRGNEDSSYSGTVPFNGIWRISNGTRLRGPATGNIGNGAIQPAGTTGTGVHRTYLYYAGGGNGTTLQWYNPGVYLIDGTEPSLNQLLGVHADQALTTEWPNIDSVNNSWTSN